MSQKHQIAAMLNEFPILFITNYKEEERNGVAILTGDLQFVIPLPSSKVFEVKSLAEKILLIRFNDDY